MLLGGNDLHQLAKEGAVDRVRKCLKKLMESRDDWSKIRDAKNSEGYNALHLAARYNRKNVVICLLEHGAQIDTPDSDDCNTPLLLAAKYVSSCFFKACFPHLSQFQAHVKICLCQSVMKTGFIMEI